jgi:pimeloyl-ACP methyl ester carboxylesterase
MYSASNHTFRSAELGERRELRLPQGLLHYYERGSGPVIVLAHGWLSNANLWRKVVPLLAGFRCITLDLPFGSHLVPMDEAADLTPTGCGQLLVSILAEMELSNVTLVGNDSGGAYSQIAAAKAAPGVVRRLVLNSCETPYDDFPPAAFAGLKQAAESAETLGRALQVLRNREFRDSPQGYGFLAKRPIPNDVSDSYALPVLSDPRILRDAAKVMQSANAADVATAGAVLAERFHGPVLFVLSEEDKFFPLANARRYASALRNARVELVTDAFSFTPEDQPEQLAKLLPAFAARAH